jgi:4-amino-4-deoxy-L-arabinose transferase-like glycosyltransferase
VRPFTTGAFGKRGAWGVPYSRAHTDLLVLADDRVRCLHVALRPVGNPCYLDWALPTSTTGGIDVLRIRALVRRQEFPVVVILLFILAFRVAWVLLAAPPAAEEDSAFYNSAAHWFMQSGTFATSDAMRPSAWVMPGYTFFLSILYWLFGSSLAAVRVAQAMLSVLTIFVLYRIALRVQGRKLGIAVVVVAGLYPPFTFANSYILTEVLYALLLCLTLLLGVRMVDKATSWNAAAFGVMLALSTYVRPAGVIWGVMPFLLLLMKVPLRRVAKYSPWWIRSGLVYDRFVPLTVSDSDTLLQGTYIMYGTSEEEYRAMVEDVLVWSSGEMQTLTAEEELQAQARYKTLALERLKDQVLHHPGKFLYKRLEATAGSFRTPYFLPDYSVPVKKGTKWAQFLLLVIPAAVALWVRRKDRRVLLVASLPVLLGIALTAVLISPRYVFPLMPAVIIMAGIGWVHTVGWATSFRSKHRRSKGQSIPS